MSTAIDHVQSDVLKNDHQFSFGFADDEMSVGIQIPKDLVWNTVQAWVEGNSKLFSKIANPFKKFLPAGTDAEDLKSMAFIAAFEAIERASAHDRLDDFVPFFCRIYKTEIMKQAKGVPVVTMVEIPLHETEGIYHDSAIDNIRFEGEVDPNVSKNMMVDQSLTLLTNSQKQFVKIILNNPCLSVADLAKQLDIHVSVVHSRVKCIVERIPLKRGNHKSTRTRRHLVIKPVSDQKCVASDLSVIIIDTNHTESKKIKKYFSNFAVSDQQNVRPDILAFGFGSKPNTSREIICPAIMKSARKGDTFLASLHDNHFDFQAGIIVGGTLINIRKSDHHTGHPASSGWGSTDSSSGRSLPQSLTTKGPPFVSSIEHAACRGSGYFGGPAKSRSTSGFVARAPNNQGLISAWGRVGFA